MARFLSNAGLNRRLALARFAVAGGIALGLCRSVHAGSYEDFFRALRLDEVQTLRRLQQRGFDFNTVDENGQSPLLLALREDSLQAAAFLIQQPKFHLDAVNAKGENALMIAALRGHSGLLRQMIGQGAEVNQPGWTPLHYAAANPGLVGVEIVRLLLDENAYIDAASPNETTALMMAARYGHRDSVRELLEAGADVSLINLQGLGAIDFAIQADRRDIIDLLSHALRVKNAPATR